MLLHTYCIHFVLTQRAVFITASCRGTRFFCEP